MWQKKLISLGKTSILHFVRLVFCAFFITILATLGIFFYSTQKTYMQNFYKEDLESFIHSKSNKVNDYFKEDIVIMHAMSKSPTVKAFLANPGNNAIQEDYWKEVEHYKSLLREKRKIFFVSNADKNFYFDTSYAYRVDEKLPEAYWFDSTMHRTKAYNFNIDHDRNLGVTPIWINFPVFYENASVGIVGLAIDINNFVAEMDEGFGSSKKFLIFNENDELLFHENSNLVKNKNYVNSVLPEGVIYKLLEVYKNKDDKLLFENGTAYIIGELPSMQSHIVASTELNFVAGQGFVYLLVLILVIAVILLFLIALYNFIKRIIKPLQHLNNLTNTILKEVPILIAVFSKSGKISLMSRHMKDFLEKNGIKDDSLFNSGNSVLSEYFRELKNRKGFFDITKEFEIEGNNRYFNVIKMDIEQDDENKEQNSILYLSDVSEQMYLANTDSLTNIANKRFFNERANAEFFNNLREKTPIAFLMLDIDFFKRLNDRYGHLVGDNALKEITKILSNIIKRRTDLLGRVGGEEFAIMLHNTDLEGARAVAEKIRTAIHENDFRIIDASTVTKITVSIGVYSAVPDPTDDFRLFLDEADKKLYEAKRLGRNRVCC